MHLNKLDTAIDLVGSFQPKDFNTAYSLVQDRVATAVRDIFTDARMNFLSRTSVAPLSVRKGRNNLSSSFQYEVRGPDGEKLLQVKVYDKVLDLLGREGIDLVGSRAREVVGANSFLTLMNLKLKAAKDAGLTRLEISLCADALSKH